MGPQDLELARQAVVILRDFLSDTEEDRPRVMGKRSGPVDQSTQGLVLYLLLRCADPEDVRHELDQLDESLAERLAAHLVQGVDWDAYDWGD